MFLCLSLQTNTQTNARPQRSMQPAFGTHTVQPIMTGPGSVPIHVPYAISSFFLSSLWIMGMWILPSGWPQNHYELLISPLKSNNQHVWMISRSPFLQIPNIFPSTRHFCWTLQLGRTFINSFVNRRRWARVGQEFLVTAAAKHGKTPVVLGNKEPFHLNLMSFIIV